MEARGHEAGAPDAPLHHIEDTAVPQLFPPEGVTLSGPRREDHAVPDTSGREARVCGPHF
jgi:hypothetical protein